MTTASLILSVAVTSALGGAVPRGVDLAALNGWNIVLGQDAIESEVWAAEEFQGLYRRAGGIKLPIVRKISRPGQHVFIGPGKAMRRSDVGFDVARFGHEDLRIVVRNGNIAIAGGRPRGTLYGVYTFLEDYLGVRFLTHDHTHVPRMGPRHRVGPVDRTYRPPLEFRWSFYAINNSRPDFAARLRVNKCPSSPGNWSGTGVARYGGKTTMTLISHSFNRQIPPAKYAREHPDYYSLFKGMRLATLKPGEGGFDFKGGRFPYGMQPCLTHPDVLRIVTQAVLDEFAVHPERSNITVAQNDGGAHCQCPRCAAIDQREGTTARSLLTFVNAVADEVAKKYPDKMIGTLAYSDTAKPPKTIRARDNVQIQLCSIGTCFIHPFNDLTCPQNVRFLEQLRGWSKITKNLYVWNYFLNDENRGYQLPLPNLRGIGPNIRFLQSHGAKGMFMQATGSSRGNELEDLRNYLLSSLIWDPTRDGGKLTDEFLDLHYGRAAPPIRRYINRLHDRSAASGKHCRCLGGRFIDYGLDESDARAGLEAFAEAMRLADDDQVRRRVEKASVWAYRAAIEPAWNAKDNEKIDPALARRMRPLARRFFELSKKHGVTRTAEGSRHTLKKAENRLHRLLGP